jgi:hypothetical protein
MCKIACLQRGLSRRRNYAAGFTTGDQDKNMFVAEQKVSTAIPNERVFTVSGWDF